MKPRREPACSSSFPNAIVGAVVPRGRAADLRRPSYTGAHAAGTQVRLTVSGKFVASGWMNSACGTPGKILRREFQDNRSPGHRPTPGPSAIRHHRGLIRPPTSNASELAGLAAANKGRPETEGPRLRHRVRPVSGATPKPKRDIQTHKRMETRVTGYAPQIRNEPSERILIRPHQRRIQRIESMFHRKLNCRDDCDRFVDLKIAKALVTP